MASGVTTDGSAAVRLIAGAPPLGLEPLHSSATIDPPTDCPWALCLREYRSELLEELVGECVTGWLRDESTFEACLREARQSALDALIPKQKEFALVEQTIAKREQAAQRIASQLAQLEGGVVSRCQLRDPFRS
jgi:hypothetical protein